MQGFQWRYAVFAVVLCLLGGISPLASTKKKIAALPAKYQEWIAEVKVLMSKEELKAFLEIEKDYQRDAYIERFWKARDPAPETERSEFKDTFYGRLATARDDFRNEYDGRFKPFLLNGEPHYLIETSCGVATWPLEIWRYNYSETLGRGFHLIFYQPNGGGPFRQWTRSEGIFPLLTTHPSDDLMTLSHSRDMEQSLVRYLRQYCIDDDVDGIISSFVDVMAEGPAGATAPLRPAPARDTEWLETFHHFSTDLPEEAPVIEARFEVDFPGVYQSRTVVRSLLAVPVEEASPVEVEGYQAYNFQLTGEVMRGEELFESFRYRFDIPSDLAFDDELTLIFERNLRPGTYALVLKLEDLNAGSFHRRTETVEVPHLGIEAADAVGDPSREDGEAVAETGPALEILEPMDDILTGSMRFEAAVRGDEIAKVSFALDGKTLLTKKRPPFSVDLSLGRVPRTHTVTATAYDAAGREVARDEVLLNAGQHHFGVELVEPQPTADLSGPVRVRAEVRVPEGAAVDRVELFHNDARLATLYSPPYVQPLKIRDLGEIVVLRAVAYLKDGNSTEDSVLLNAPGLTEETDVRLVELFTLVLDAQGRPRQGLGRDEFSIFENGVEQEVLRFDRLDDLPIHAALLIDTSASMQENLGQVNQAALSFLKSTITEKDRAAIITFSEKPLLLARLTNDMQELSRALAGLHAERSTALYDSIVYSLYYLKGLTGQRALLVLSDGDDRLSEYDFEETVELVSRENVTIYTIGIELKKLSEGRRRLATLARQTGGQSFFIKSVTELAAIYDTIQKELRSQYLLAYQSSHGMEDDSFRTVEVKVGSGGEARTLRGYYP